MRKIFCQLFSGTVSRDNVLVVSSELLQMGGSLDLQMISTPSSIIPRAFNTKVKMQVLGKSLNLFEVSTSAPKSLSLWKTRKPQKSNILRKNDKVQES